MTDHITESLLNLLGDERRAICSAKFDVLDTLAEQKIKMFDTLMRGKADPADLARISEQLRGNQTLFAAAIDGVKAARTRIEALHEVRVGLNVYDQSGQMAKVVTNQSGLEKKA